jgi:glycolate oxidase FAD binding subunit
MTVATSHIEDLQAVVREGPRVLPIGAGTKPALSAAPEGVVSVDVSGLSGIVDYDPAELTFTALAGTPVTEVAQVLAEYGQYLPFDPPLARAGATLGGAVAAGISGSNAFRHGGVRDFIIGVQFVDGMGRLISGGGKVVKNAAGFDLPKLMVGSMGRLGVLVRLSFKVFPRPRATTTVCADFDSTEAALSVMAQLGRGPLALDALDLEPPSTLIARIGGAQETLPARAVRLEAALGAGAQQMRDDQDAELWRAVAEFAWVPTGSTLVKIGATPRRLPALEVLLATTGAQARYSLGGNLAWVAWPTAAPLHALDAGLRSLELAGMVVRGAPSGSLLLGKVTGGAFARRVRAAIDPDSRFLEL